MFKRLCVLSILLTVGVATWALSSRLSADAFSISAGMLFGAMVIIPVYMLVRMGNSKQQRDKWHVVHEDDERLCVRPAALIETSKPN